jgi:5-methyltetrahydrofolate--homocysteine methyltransferase
MEILNELFAAVQNGKHDETAAFTEKAMAGGHGPEAILENTLIPAMKIVGEKFSRGEFFVPEMLVAARAMNRALEILEPDMVKKGVPARGTMVIGTVFGDLHDIGKNLVAIMFRGAGYRVVDLGVDVPMEKFLAASREHEPDVIGLSALLTTTMVSMEEIVRELKNQGRGAKILVGGASVSDDFARDIGADGYADNAVDALALVNG